MPAFLRAAVLAVLLLLVPLLAGAQEVLPGLGIQLLEVPADAADDPRANIYITDHVEPGALIERRIAVSNGTDAPFDVDLYGTTADVEDGWVVADGRGGNELANWIEVTPATLSLDPGERREALVRIRVPEDASGGERYAAVLAETGGDDDGPGVQVVSRVGIRVYLSVGGPEAPAEDFQIDSLTGGRTEDGAPFVRVAVSNTGGRALDIAGELALEDGPGDLRAGPFPVALPQTIGPGDEGVLDVPMDAALPDGPWLIRADLASGLVERSAEATITFPAEGLGEAVDADAPVADDRDLRPVILGALVLIPLVLLALLLLLLRRRRRRADEDDAEDAAVDDGGADPADAGAPTASPPPEIDPMPSMAPPPPAAAPPSASPAPPSPPPAAPQAAPTPPAPDAPPPPGPVTPQVPLAPSAGPREAPAAPPIPPSNP